MTYKLPVLYSRADAKQRREVREQYIQQQNGLCYWCNCSLDAAPPKEITSKKITQISQGHRNPQGILTIGKDLYISEHGPHGPSSPIDQKLSSVEIFIILLSEKPDTFFHISPASLSSL